MRWLPLDFDRDRRVGWPVSETSAAVFAEAVLSEDACLSAGILAAQLARDPHFSLWSLARAALLSDGEQLRCIESLANWLANNALRALGPAEYLSHGPQDDASLLEQWADRAAFQVHLAELAVSLAGEDAPNRASEIFLLGLLWRADEWTVELSPELAPALKELLPDWLRSSVAQNGSGVDAGAGNVASRSPVSGVVVAFDQLTSRGARREELAQQHATCEQRGGEARRQWLASVPGAGANLHVLADRLGRLAQLESRFAETLETEKLEAIAEFAAGAGHEINNPLAVISGRAQLFLKHENDPQRRRELALINSQTLRIYEMIADMMLFARPPSPVPERFDLSALIEKLIGELVPQASARKIELCRVGRRESLSIEADATQCMIALKAICENAIGAIGQSGRIEIEIDEIPREYDLDTNNAGEAEASAAMNGGSGQDVRIIVRDNGPGIPAHVRRHLFDPFYSGRGAGRGLGLGLSKSWRIVTNHGGRIEVESRLDQGATFTITLPAEFRAQNAGDASHPKTVVGTVD